MKSDTSTVTGTELMTISDTARALRVDPTTIRRWVKDGALAAIVLPKRVNGKRNSYRILRSEIDALLEKTSTLATRLHANNDNNELIKTPSLVATATEEDNTDDYGNW